MGPLKKLLGQLGLRSRQQLANLETPTLILYDRDLVFIPEARRPLAIGYLLGIYRNREKWLANTNPLDRIENGVNLKDHSSVG